MIRFLLDEHVPNAVAHGLQLRGIEVFTAADAGLLSVPDDKVIDYALQNRLVIFTQDDDYPRLHGLGVKHAGIIYCKQGSRSLGEIIQFLKLIADSLDEEDIFGCIEHA